MQRVEITGSRIKRIDAEGASPVDVIRREDIVKTGVTSVRELLDTLTVTSTNGSINDVNGSGTFSPGASQASLRNLGAQSTLLLLNGRRLAMYPLPNFQETFSNLDTLPLEAVDRVEILKVGGSAVYGSDAIAGVINIITRNSFQGVQVDASTQHSLKTGLFLERAASLTFGIGDYDADGYNLLVNTEVFRREPVMWNRVLSKVNPTYAAVSGSFGTPSSYGYPGNVIGQGAIPSDYQCPPNLVRGANCYYDRYSRFEAVPLSERENSMFNFTKKLSAEDQLYVEGLFSKIRAEYQSPYLTYGSNNSPTTWLDYRTGATKHLGNDFLTPDNPLNHTGDFAEFRYRFVDSGGYEHTDTEQFRLVGGIKGAVKGWDYDTGIGAMGGNTKDRSRGLFSESGFRTMIGDPGDAFDPYDASASMWNMPGGYRPGQKNSQQVIDTLFPEYGFDASTRQYFWDGKLSGPIDAVTLPGGPISIATGFELRHENMVLSPTNNVATQDVVGFAFSESDAARNFGAVFVEADLPVTKRLDFGIAGRIDKFPNIGAHFSPRANFKLKATDDLLFRGTIETGFRAPNLQESSPSTKTAFQPGVSDPKRCPAATDIANGYRAYADANFPRGSDDWNLYYAFADQIYSQECANSIPIVVYNNPNLKPETSRSMSLGSAFQVTRHWAAALDWWRIERKNEINIKSVQDLLSAESGQAPGVVNRDPLDPTGATDPTFTADDIANYGITAGPLASVRLQYGNTFKTKTSGVDFDVHGDIPTPIGRWAIASQATYTAEYRAFSPTRYGTGGWGDNLAGRYGYPQWQLNVTNSLTTGPFTNTIRWVHQSGMKLQGDFNEVDSLGVPIWGVDGCATVGVNADQCSVGSYNRWDYDLSWDGVKGLTIGAHVFNVLGKRPPVDMRAFGGNSGIIPSNLEDVQGRMLKIYASYKF